MRPAIPLFSFVTPILLGTLVLVEPAQATGSSLLKVTMDYGLGSDTVTGGYTVSANETLTVGLGNNFRIYVWRTSGAEAVKSFETPAGIVY